MDYIFLILTTIYFLSLQNISCTIKILNEILNCIEYTFYDPDHLPIHKIINYFDLNSWQPTLWLILPITYYSLPPIITLDIWAFITFTTKQYGSRPHIFMKFFYVPSYLSYFITFDIIRDVSILAEFHQFDDNNLIFFNYKPCIKWIPEKPTTQITVYWNFE